MNTSSGGQEHAILKTNFSSLIWSQSRHVTVSRLSSLPQFKRNVVWIPAQEGRISHLEHAILKTNFSSLIWSQSRHVTVSRLSPLPQFKRNVVWIPAQEDRNTPSWKPILAPLSEVNQDMWLSQDFHLYHNSKEMWCEYQLRRARTRHLENQF